MKILHLYLKNFAHIYSGLGKYEIDLDFTNSNKVINVLIGKMGSCKTVILGSLQPFASFGTLDVRNQDDLILPEVDGIKIIEYSEGMDIYKISHEYTWNKNTHNIKSYIQKNDVEMNPNGNQSSFKLIVENEMGIEQNFLRLIRLGSNVSNVINMKSTERKSFIASLLKDAEVYTLLYKKLSEDMRNINSQITILTNKLNHIGLDHELDIQKEYEDNLEAISQLNESYTNLKEKIFKSKGYIESVLKDQSYESYQKEYNDYLIQKEEIQSQLKDLQNQISKLKSSGYSLDDVTKKIGALDLYMAQLNENIDKSERLYQEKSNELSRYVDNQKIKNSQSKLEDLHSTYDELNEKVKDYESIVKGFKSPYSATQITSLLGDLKTMDILIDDIAQYDIETIKKIYSSDSSINTWSKKQIEFLNIKKLKMQKDINNIRYSEKYETPSTLYFPPFCPTKSCPYYKTHPDTIKKQIESKENEANPELERILQEVDMIDIKIAKLEVYPIVYSKLATLRVMWKQHYHMLEQVHALKEKSLLFILTNLQGRQWYDGEKLSTIIELCQKRDYYYQLVENLVSVKAELQSLELSKDSTIEERINELEKEIDGITENLAGYEADLKSSTEELKSYNSIYLQLSQLSNMERDLDQIKNQSNNILTKLSTMEKNINLLDDAEQEILHLQSDEVEIYSKLKSLTEKNEQIKATIHDLKYTKAEFNKVLEDKENLRYILDAVSSKEGIPLVLVKMFLNNCRDIVNELVSDVFGDILEILEFKITENEFKIPYSINGVKVDDIERASQGQQSVISIALSFALVRQSMFKYNIMLLDEVDGPLYKRDRSKFVTILMKQLHAINGEQVFLISHNTEIFNQMNVNYICTTPEIIDNNEYNSVMYV